MDIHPVYKAFTQFFDTPPKGLLVAFSGGLDSTVLLHLASNYARLNQIPLRAIYINHGLSPYADDWQSHCEQVCIDLGVSFQAIPVVLERGPRQSLEALARDARYQALLNAASDDDVILLGQHQDDQVETFLLQLKRGAGLKGLASMAPRKHQHGHALVRPLLDISRSAIASYAKDNGLSWVEDESNLDEEFDRNFLRQSVLPLITKRFVGFNKAVARSARLLQQQAALIDEYAQADFQTLHFNGTLSVSALAALSVARRNNVLRHWFSIEQLFMPSEAQMMEINKQVFAAKADANVLIQLGTKQLRRYRDRLYLVLPQAPIEPVSHVFGYRVPLSNGQVLNRVVGEGVRPPNDDEQISILFGMTSSRFKPQGKPGSNKLSHWFKEAGVPPWLRSRIPLVFYNDVCVQVVGYWFHQDYVTQDGQAWVCQAHEEEFEGLWQQ